MFKPLISFLLAAVLAVGCLGSAKSSPKVTPVDPYLAMLASIAPIEMQTEDGSYTRICTSASININRNYWLTAAHCVPEANPETGYAPHLQILGEVANPVHVDYDKDLAVLQTASAHLPARPIAFFPPKFGDPLILAGHTSPIGMAGPILTFGWVAHPSLIPNLTAPYDRPQMLIQIPGAPGHSGSPVLNKNGDVVSVLQSGWGRSWGPVVMGAPFSDIRDLVSYWLE